MTVEQDFEETPKKRNIKKHNIRGSSSKRKSKKPEKKQDEKLGDRIRLARGSRGVSQQDVADHIGISVQQMQKMEKGINRVSAIRLREIADYLGMSIVWFLKEDDSFRHEDSRGINLHAIPLSLIRDYQLIEDEKVRRAVHVLMSALAGLWK